MSDCRVSLNTSEQLISYPAFKTTLDRRIARLLEKSALASRLLLVSVSLPPEDIWSGQDEMWRYMLENVRLHI
ncbi:hypothetical protein HPL003_00955 [Paenibacillus terrae HPL-003]|uniref:Uncharacterized protein n=1 Tax=Paenibacillus terrae (strain HPL-003) TaxID=985665 RepID=G7VVE1_PAETH|nr:hypothetical protein [Paenibacillus terrae]AET56975.1 hypothetical protein HPL003_00955 [Paenibacillus terrae HPL-003]